jgi:hypothetical protein
MEQMGQMPGSGCRIWGCMEQVQTVSETPDSVVVDFFSEGRPNHQPSPKRVSGRRMVRIFRGVRRRIFGSFMAVEF